MARFSLDADLLVCHLDFAEYGFVMPAQASIQIKKDRDRDRNHSAPLYLCLNSLSAFAWIPAFAGMT
jgi:hypothetical protein